MLLNQAEKWLVNNPVRELIQRRFEAPRLLHMGGAIPGAHALEVGCGRGAGVDIIIERFGAARVDAFDLDPDMVRRAEKRLARRGEQVRLWVGDATAIDAPDDTYDAVFDFAIIHHIPDWRAAVREIHRVLRPGGQLYAEEVLIAVVRHPLWRRVFAHPVEDRFDARGFRHGLLDAGFDVIDEHDMAGRLAWFVARKPVPGDIAR